MRNRTLHQLLQAFTEDSGLQLAAETARGAEIPFEVIEEPGARSALYCYRPLTGNFIRSRMGILDRLPSYLPAARAIAAIEGIDAYLRARGEPRIPPDERERADAVLRSFLSAVYAESSEFGFQPERFAAAYTELETALYEGRQVALVLAPLLGLALESDEVPLGEGLALVRGETLPDAPPEAVWSTPGEVEHGTVLAVLTLEGERLAGPPLSTARARFRRLLSALRLFDEGSYALGPLAWAQLDGGPWQVAPLGGSGRARGRTALTADQEDELRAFCSLVARRTPRAGEVAWALARFEMARERLSPFEALTDDLLALRALLEPEGAESGRLAQRLAVICGLPEERGALAERVARAVTLERTVIGGLAQPEGSAEGLLDELSGHLRALLRDILCGHLDSDVRTLADELLAEAAAEPLAS
ncbi:hypothetical protein [Conexibacter woesei]|uniref:Uncharacterized protein n=1 Tax=Conexibacter woesei (strain DSM 14684 / CCUG 47730 / CIP 108061 / JCM 11494 / NBRC 100937 / ID131577) TaxID=469383 RepID=D3F9Z7_CONWI|nr:hypothetical protein [Conexibacter woesei]ADB53092.1 hypothetical protein Cwoe_4679 [Conexibacter woesei DSM 14684]